MKYPVGDHDFWEDSYSATALPSFDALLEEAESIWLGHYASLNWPVWVEYDEDDEQEWDCGRTVSVGVLMPRKGRTHIYIAPATPEQVHELRIVLMRVWANRADSGFRRWTHELVTA